MTGRAGACGLGAGRAPALLAASPTSYARLAAAAFAIADRRSASSTFASDVFTTGGSFTGSGDRRTSVRHEGRAIGSTAPTWNRIDRTSTPRARSCATIVSASSDSSCAHVELAVRTCSTPRTSRVGRARRAILVPTASSQSCAATGGGSFPRSLSAANFR
ncbi:MAG: hypothetical protein U0441_09320 [Polyangiaceae bacterium]